MGHARRAGGALLMTALAAPASLALLAALGPDWTRFPPASCLATHCFCELPRGGALVLQPANSWSSLAFVAVGAWIMLGAHGAGRDDTSFRGWPAWWFGMTGIVIGIGSFLLHATLTLWGQFYDVLGMYLLSGFIGAYAARRWLGLSNAMAVVLYFAICAILAAFLWIMPETRRWLFAIVLVAAIAIELIFARPRRTGVRVRYFLCGLIAYAIAFAIWILDNTGALCAPESLVQGHAAWHLLGAAALFWNYAYYRSERA